MRIFTKEQIAKSKGRMVLFYSRTGAGKTCSTLLSAPEPIFYLKCENRNLEPTLDVINKYKPDLDFDMGEYESFSDTMEILNRNEKMFDRHRTIVVDSLTDLMAVKLNHEIQNETFDALSDDKKKKILIAQSKLSLEGYGGLSAQTLRFTDTIARYAMNGKYVILLARLDQNPSWARHYEFAPLLKGKEYGKDFEGMFDLIGFVRPREEVKDGKRVVLMPPGVSFESDDGTFMAKWTGVGDKRHYILDVSKILKANE